MQPQSKEEYLEEVRLDRAQYYTNLVINQVSVSYTQAILGKLLAEYHSDCKMVYENSSAVSLPLISKYSLLSDILNSDQGPCEKLYNIKALLEGK